jgi:antitoxin HicB
MKTYTYKATLEPGDKKGVTVVTFRDVPEAITEGRGENDALVQAQDALGLALLSYPMRGLPLPAAKSRAGKAITPDAEVGAKLALLEAFADSGMTKTDLARELGKDEKEVRRLLDPMHATKLPSLSRALAVFGKRLVIGVEPVAA